MAVRSKNPEDLGRANAIATVRSERGYSATKYDASPAKLPKSLRRQFGQKYDGKKVRNILWHDHRFEPAHFLLRRHGRFPRRLRHSFLAAPLRPKRERKHTNRSCVLQRVMPTVICSKAKPEMTGYPQAYLGPCQEYFAN